MTRARCFSVGETLQCLKHVVRVDGRSCINPGDLVKVTQTFEFIYEGKQCQDITVQKGDDMPISVIVAPGRFQRIT